MAAPRKHPPIGAAETIQRLAAEGYSKTGLAMHFKVAISTLNRWLDEDEALNEAFEFGREEERLMLHKLLIESAKRGAAANVNVFFALKARHGYRENDKVESNVAVNISQPVLYVHSSGTDEQWAARAAAQQSRLVADAALDAQRTTLRLPASTSVPQTSYRPQVNLGAPGPAQTPAAMPVAPSWPAPSWRGRA